MKIYTPQMHILYRKTMSPHSPTEEAHSSTSFSLWKWHATLYGQRWTSMHLFGCLLRKLSLFHMRLGDWLDKKKYNHSLLSLSRCHLGNVTGQFCGYRPLQRKHSGRTTSLYPIVHRNQLLFPTWDGQGLGGSAGGGGNNPDLVAEKKNTYC